MLAVVNLRRRSSAGTTVKRLRFHRGGISTGGLNREIAGVSPQSPNRKHRRKKSIGKDASGRRRSGVEKAAHRVEFTKVNGENEHVNPPWFGGEIYDNRELLTPDHAARVSQHNRLRP